MNLYEVCMDLFSGYNNFVYEEFHVLVHQYIGIYMMYIQMYVIIIMII